MNQKISPSTVALNKKARHLYELSEFTEAGIVLTGPEVKSIRAGKVNFIDSYVDFRQGEAWLVSLHIAPYANAGYVSQEPDRARKLLMHEREISKFAGLVAQQGLTVVPVRLYFKRGKIKVEIALGKGKKLHDHRETLKRRAEERDMARELS
ncbi:SsrA-binding protein SmpB [uncultured Desulfovibrio sp.]|uniref:SsrA-binding protein SmpB n=1 Tax=uncultured Desulfovibrio sp. TaxID=167968 RepID=UPI0026147A1F|nr:SsrA-binding protein SmpB [uncultured Desulfovibrio sp.]